MMNFHLRPIQKIGQLPFYWYFVIYIYLRMCMYRSKKKKLAFIYIDVVCSPTVAVLLVEKSFRLSDLDYHV